MDKNIHNPLAHIVTIYLITDQRISQDIFKADDAVEAFGAIAFKLEN